MADIYRESRTYRRERDDSPSEDEDVKYTSAKVRRYKVTQGRPERIERVDRDDFDDDRRSRYSAQPGRSSGGDLLEVDRRFERTSFDRPHSAIGAREREIVERKVIERDARDDRDFYYSRDRDDGRPRSTYFEQERERRLVDPEPAYPETRRTVVERQIIDRDRDDDFIRLDDRDRGDKSRTMVYEKTKEVERDRDWDRQSRMPWERDERETDLRMEKRVERRDDGDVRIERRVEERRGSEPYPPEIERYRRETEIYEPPPAPIVIRQRMPEQKIIVQEAPAPPPVVIRQERDRQMVRREPREDEEYYYRREERNEVGSYRGDRRDDDRDYAGAVVAGGRGRDRDYRRDRHSDDDRSDDEYYVKRTIVRRERSASGSPDHHHKRHLAEGALAGAGLAALLASRRNDYGELPEHRGRKVLGGAVVGALGTEVVRRAKSAYDDRYGSPDRGRSRSRSRGGDDDRHSKLKTGLGIAAAALAVAGAAKYYQSTKVDREEAVRGRSRRRDEYSDYSRSPSRKRSRSRSVAKAALGTAAAAALVQHLRHKSQARNGSKSRSRSRLRTGAEIVAAGLVGAAGKKLYDRHKEKKELERELEEEDEYYREMEDRDRRHGGRSRSRSAHSSRHG